MKKLSFLMILLVSMVATSCMSVRVAVDYDQKADFNQYKTFAFFKEGIDRVQVSDLDKKRILNAITENLQNKGFSLSSDNPQLLVNIFTKENERVDIYNNVGFGWGWGPFWGGSYYNVSAQKEGILYIELIDNQKKQLVWQGQGSGSLPSNYSSVKVKNERIKEFVNEILNQYPPTTKK